MGREVWRLRVRHRCRLYDSQLDLQRLHDPTVLYVAWIADHETTPNWVGVVYCSLRLRAHAHNNIIVQAVLYSIGTSVRVVHFNMKCVRFLKSAIRLEA